MLTGAKPALAAMVLGHLPAPSRLSISPVPSRWPALVPREVVPFGHPSTTAVIKWDRRPVTGFASATLFVATICALYV